MASWAVTSPSRRQARHPPRDLFDLPSRRPLPQAVRDRGYPAVLNRSAVKKSRSWGRNRARAELRRRRRCFLAFKWAKFRSQWPEPLAALLHSERYRLRAVDERTIHERQWHITPTAGYAHYQYTIEFYRHFFAMPGFQSHWEATCGTAGHCFFMG